MPHNYLNKIKLLENDIEYALRKSDFHKLASLSTQLELLVENLANDPSFKKSITQKELVDLQNFRKSLEKYQEKTSLKFKDYTMEISKKRKMHQAYKA